MASKSSVTLLHLQRYVSSILRLVFPYSIAAWLAQLDKSLSAKREAAGSKPGRTNTKGPKINEDNVLSMLWHIQMVRHYKALTIWTEIPVKDFRQVVLVFFLASKTGTRLSCTIYKIPVNFPLSLDMKPGTSNPDKKNGTENFGRFGKKWIPRKVLLFFRKISTGMISSIWILPGIRRVVSSILNWSSENFSELSGVWILL